MCFNYGKQHLKISRLNRVKSILGCILLNNFKTGLRVNDNIVQILKNGCSTSVQDWLETTQKGLYPKLTHLHKAHLDFAGYATEAVEKENFIIWPLTVKSTKTMRKTSRFLNPQNSF